MAWRRLLLVLVGVFVGAQAAHAAGVGFAPTQKERIVEARVESIVRERNTMIEGRPYLQQMLRVVRVDNQAQLSVDTGNVIPHRSGRYRVGDVILLGQLESTLTKEQVFYVVGHKRLDTVYVLVGIFVVLTLLVARRRGVMSIMSMIVSFVVVAYGTLPLLLQGHNPIGVSIATVAILIPIMFYTSHGASAKTTIAIVSTVVTLIFVSILAYVCVHSAHLSGVIYDEVDALLLAHPTLELSGLVIAGIVISVLGILDDVTMSQASVVAELSKDNEHIGWRALFDRSMNVGRDHIASVANTLILVYAGSSLATLLLLLQYPRPLPVILNSELIVMQIVIMLVGSIGLVIAVPITTWIASIVLGRQSTH